MTSKPSRLRFVVLSSLAILAIAAGGVAHGLVTDRWGLPAQVAAISARVLTLPVEIDSWASTETPLDPRQLEMAGAVGATSRTYVDSITGERVQIHVLAGRPGPISLHEPTVCFTGAGLTQVEPLTKYDVAGRSAGVKCSFQRRSFNPASRTIVAS